jgi:hypothetical protein
MKPINEGPLEAFGYDSESAVLRLRFASGAVDFYGVTPALYQQFLETFPKKDFFFNVLSGHPAKEVADEELQGEAETEPIVVNARMIERDKTSAIEVIGRGLNSWITNVLVVLALVAVLAVMLWNLPAEYRTVVTRRTDADPRHRIASGLDRTVGWLEPSVPVLL